MTNPEPPPADRYDYAVLIHRLLKARIAEAHARGERNPELWARLHAEDDIAAAIARPSIEQCRATLEKKTCRAEQRAKEASP